MTDSRETIVELITAGLLVLVFVLYLLGALQQSVAMLLGGLVLLGSGGYQTSKGWRVSLLTWVLGVVLTLGGIGLRIFLVSRLRINWLPIVLLLIAVVYAWHWWSKHH